MFRFGGSLGPIVSSDYGFLFRTVNKHTVFFKGNKQQRWNFTCCEGHDHHHENKFLLFRWELEWVYDDLSVECHISQMRLSQRKILMLKVGPFYQFSTTHLGILYSGKLFSSWLKKKNLLLCALWVFLKLHKNKKFSLAVCLWSRTDV